MGRNKKNRHQFIKDEEGFVNVYIDGCCLNAERRISASGYGIYWGPQNTCKVYGPCKRRAKNNVADIQSAYIAIISANQLCVTKLCINTDSKLVYDAATYLTDEWKEDDWLTLYMEQTTLDRRCFRKFKKAICETPGIEIKFKYIKAHSGDQHHEEAVHLAEKGAERHCNYEILEVLNLNLNNLNLN